MSDGGVDAAAVLARRRRSIGIAASAGLVLLALALAFQGGEEARSVDTSPHFVAATDLADLEGALGHELYWAGERQPDRVELTEEGDGSVYLRYLPAAVEAGDPRSQFLTVGTYPVAGAVAALRRAADKDGSALGRAPDGGVLLVNPSSDGSVYLAYPGSDLQIEVYDPVPGRALGLIRAGAIEPVG